MKKDRFYSLRRVLWSTRFVFVICYITCRRPSTSRLQSKILISQARFLFDSSVTLRDVIKRYVDCFATSQSPYSSIQPPTSNLQHSHIRTFVPSITVATDSVNHEDDGITNIPIAHRREDDLVPSFGAYRGISCDAAQLPIPLPLDCDRPDPHFSR